MLSESAQDLIGSNLEIRRQVGRQEGPRPGSRRGQAQTRRGRGRLLRKGASQRVRDPSAAGTVPARCGEIAMQRAGGTCRPPTSNGVSSMLSRPSSTPSTRPASAARRLRLSLKFQHSEALAGPPAIADATHFSGRIQVNGQKTLISSVPSPATITDRGRPRRQ